MSDIVKPVGALTDEAVQQFLLDNPSFFEKHQQLLSEIRIPHQSGKTISLVERQVSALRERNVEMRNRLTNLLDNARENDRLFDKTKRLVLALLDSHDLASCCDTLLHSFEHDFKIHHTQLIIFNNKPLNAGKARIDDIFTARGAVGQRIQSRRTVMGGLNMSELEYVFGEQHQVGSAALSVLNHGQVIGLLAVGNQDPLYYNDGMGTLFLGYISEVLSKVLPAFIHRESHAR